MKKIIVVFLFFSHFASAENPSWVLNKPKNDSVYKYYVGRSSIAGSQSDSFREATRDAFEQAIRENFGFSASISSESFESLEKTSLTRRIKELSQRTQLHDFELIDSFSNNKDKGWESWVLYKYPLAEIIKEKQRQANLKNEPEPVFSTQGNDADINQGAIEIVTDPARATVLIDNEASGRTPIRITGQFEIGEHFLRIEHENYDPIEEKIIIVPQKNIRVNKTLVRSKGTLSISSNPSGAFVVISGKPIGLTPLKDEVINAGEKVQIEITHPDAERFMQEVTVSRDEIRNLDFNLPLKPAFLAVSSDPQGADLFIDDRPIGTTGKLKMTEVSPGSVSIRLVKSGYKDLTTTVQIKGGQRLVLPTIKLTSLSSEEKENRDFPTKLTFDLNGQEATTKNATKVNTLINIGFGLEKFFFTRLSIKGSAGLILPQMKGTNSSSDNIGLYIDLEPRLYLLRALAATEFGFSIFPTVGYFSYKESGVSNPKSYAQSYFGYGANLEYRIDDTFVSFGVGQKTFSNSSSSDGATNIYGSFSYGTYW